MKSQKKEITFEILENSELDKISEIGMDGIMLNESDKTRILKASRDKYEKSLTDNSSFRTEDNYKEVKVYRQNRLKTIIPAVICNVALIFLVIGVINVLKKDDYNITVTPPATESTEIQTTTQSDVTTSVTVTNQTFSEYIAVPDFSNCNTIEEVNELASEYGLVVQQKFSWSDDIPGTIIEIFPPANETIKAGSDIIAIISIGPLYDFENADGTREILETLEDLFDKIPDFNKPLINKGYFIYDINDNSTDEYWLFGDTKDLNQLHIFTLNESEYELSVSLTSTEGFKLCESLDAIWTTSESDNNYTNNIYQISDNDEITMIDSFKCIQDTENNPVSYWHNEKEITENEYTELIKNYNQFDWIIPRPKSY